MISIRKPLADVDDFDKDLPQTFFWDYLCLIASPDFIGFGVGIDPGSNFPLVGHEAALLIDGHLIVHFPQLLKSEK